LPLGQDIDVFGTAWVLTWKKPAACFPVPGLLTITLFLAGPEPLRAKDSGSDSLFVCTLRRISAWGKSIQKNRLSCLSRQLSKAPAYLPRPKRGGLGLWRMGFSKKSGVASDRVAVLLLPAGDLRGNQLLSTLKQSRARFPLLPPALFHGIPCLPRSVWSGPAVFRCPLCI
jgi:hypothetical protein